MSWSFSLGEPRECNIQTRCIILGVLPILVWYNHPINSKFYPDIKPSLPNLAHCMCNPNHRAILLSPCPIYLLFREGDEKLCTSLATPSSCCLFISTLIEQSKQLCRVELSTLSLPLSRNLGSDDIRTGDWHFCYETFAIFLRVSVSQNFVSVKKSRFRFRKNLVSVSEYLVSEKSLGFGIFGLGKKVLVSVSEKFGLGKKSRYLFWSKFWYRHSVIRTQVNHS